MIKGLWTSSEFKNNTQSKSIFGKRKKALIAIELALDEAHKATEEDALLWLYFVEKASNEWIKSHPNTSATPSKGKKTSNRRKGIESLLRQIKTKREQLYKISPEERQRQQDITSQYETSNKDLNIAPGNKDPRGMKGRAAFHQELLEKTIERATALGHSKNDFNTEQLGFLAAKAALKIDSVIDKKKHTACQIEALRILCAMLGKNRTLATQFEASGVEVVVVPADRPMTDLPEFSSLKGVSISQGSGGARTWDPTRGVGGLVVGPKMYVAVTEENLLGTAVGPAVSAIGGGCYANCYSTTSHEFAHGIHMSTAMTALQKQAITSSFIKKKRVSIDAAYDRLIVDDPTFTPSQPSLDALFSQEWVDGPRRKQTPLATPKLYWVFKGSDYAKDASGAHFRYSSRYDLQDCYAAFDEREYFAQCVNAYLGANGGNDPYTNRPRQNGQVWVRANEENTMVNLLDELFSAGTTNAYAKSQLENTNDSGVDVQTVGDYIKAKVAEVKAQKAAI